MVIEDMIDIDKFKVVTREILESKSLDIMANHLAQLLVGILEIKGCSVFIFNPESKELEVLGSFGLSVDYMTKGPVLVDKSIGSVLIRKPVVIKDITNDERLQYPEEARKEGIGAIVSIPIMLYGEPVGAFRLYHYEAWDISERDLDSLMLLGENIGLAMTHTRVLNAVQSLKGIIDEIHPIWLKTNSD
ncbi:MAG: GAF domain-containing protein [Deltaproteobacteria bacterium]|nr:GAF domain-containing protein [Deltaproteobacteria bacterium]